MKKILFFSILAFASSEIFGQAEFFEGPRTVFVGDTIYYYYNGTSGNNGSWSINGTSASIIWSDADIAQVRITSQGSFYITHTNTVDGYKELFILSYSEPPTPSNPFITSTDCGQVTIEMNTSQIPFDIEWYWQTTPNGQSTSLGNYFQKIVTESGTYYLQSKSAYSNAWGGTSSGITVTVPPVPSPPTENTISRCGYGSVTLTTTAGANGNSLKWYSDETSTTPLYTGLQYMTPSLTTPTTYYVSTYHTSDEDCESATRTPVTANIITPPSPGVLYSSNASDQVCVGGTLQISVQGNQGTPYFWISSNNGTSWDREDAANLGNPFTYTFDTEGLWIIRTVSEGTQGCWSSEEETIQIYVRPIPSVPTNLSSSTACAGGTVTLNASPGENGDGVRWYDTNVSTEVLSAQNYYITTELTASRNYFVSTHHSVAVCESPRVQVTANILPLLDAPIVSGYHRMGPGTLSLTASGAPVGSVYEWYDVNNQLKATGPTYMTPTVEESTSNYVYVKAAYDPCPSTPTWVDAILEPLPVIVATPAYIIEGQSVVLDAGVGYSTYEWRRESGGILGTNQIYETNIPGKYSVTVTKVGVAGNGVSSYKLTTPVGGQNINYIIKNTVLIESIKDEDYVEILPVDSLHQTVQYFDGVGRPIQTVTTQGSPGKQDIVQPVVYDQYGREELKYLPFTAETTGRYKDNIIDLDTKTYIGVAQSFYTPGSNNAIADDTTPYAETIFEPSPLNRVLKQGAPGAVWQPNADPNLDRSIKMAYEFNGANEVLLFTYDPVADMISASKNGSVRYYGPYQLHANKTLDERNNEVIEYVDKQGRTVLKKVQYKEEGGTKYYTETYYIYDDFGNLVVVLPPEAVKQMGTLFTEN